MDDNTPDTVKRSRKSIDRSQRHALTELRKKSAGQKTTTTPNRNKMADIWHHVTSDDCQVVLGEYKYSNYGISCKSICELYSLLLVLYYTNLQKTVLALADCSML